MGWHAMPSGGQCVKQPAGLPCHLVDGVWNNQMVDSVWNN